MSARKSTQDILARLEGGVRDLAGDVVAVRRAQRLNLLATVGVGGVAALATTCLVTIVLVGGGDASKVAVEPLAAEVRTLQGELGSAITRVEAAAAQAATRAAEATGSAAGAVAVKWDQPTKTAAASPGADPEAAPLAALPAPAEDLARVTLMPAEGGPRSFLLRTEEEATLAVVDGSRPEDGAAAVEAPAPELDAAARRRLGMRALLMRDRLAAEGAPNS